MRVLHVHGEPGLLRRCLLCTAIGHHRVRGGNFNNFHVDFKQNATSGRKLNVQGERKKFSRYDFAKFRFGVRTPQIQMSIRSR